MQISKEETITRTSDNVVSMREDWMTSKWRPAMAWAYMVICIFDFMIGPIVYQVFAAYTKANFGAWHPLTLEGSGLFHVAMGAVLGVSAWTRGQEKIERITNGSA